MSLFKTAENPQGLAGVIAGDSSICLCGAEDESLLYRGYSIEDLAANSTFEEVSWLLLHGELPQKAELQNYRKRLATLKDINGPEKHLLEMVSKYAHPMDMLRTAVSFLGNEEQDTILTDPVASSERLLSALPTLLTYWWNFHKNKRKLQTNIPSNSIAEQFLSLLHGTPPNEQMRRALDVALILYAEHEFNASTFTVRTIASTLSDYFSAIVGGIGALRGPLHGGANEWAMELIQSSGTPDKAEKKILEMLAEKKLIMGFGHRVYKKGDPRSAIIKKWAKKLAETTNKMNLFEAAERIETVMLREKKLFPNLDFYSAVVFHCLNIPTVLFTPLFVMSRTAGWSAHFLEQHNHNKLIRPLSNYIGPKHRFYIPMESRS
ncbi:MAG: citrate/2-methylcitrate synthase [Parachlamydiales bacterium]|jgi:2-methylcitrate synthase